MSGDRFSDLAVPNSDQSCLAAIVPGKPELVHGEPIPFRFTPNFQRFIGPHGTEGLLTSSLVAIARSLTESEVRNGGLMQICDFPR